MLINQIGEHIIAAGGKRMRPAVVLLAARALGCKTAEPELLAAVIEFIHTATLLHDDVVDESSLRRGRKTANAQFGNAASVLVGDFLYSRAFQMIVDAGSLRVMKVLAVEVVMVDRIDEVPAQHRVDVLEIDDHASLRIEGSTDRHLDDVVVAVVGSTGAEDLTVAFVGPVRAA